MQQDTVSNLVNFSQRLGSLIEFLDAIDDLSTSSFGDALEEKI